MYSISIFVVNSKHKLGSEHNFDFAWLSVELSTFLNCDLTLIYLLQRVRAKAQKRVGAGELLEIGVNMALAGVFIA